MFRTKKDVDKHVQDLLKKANRDIEVLFYHDILVFCTYFHISMIYSVITHTSVDEVHYSVTEKATRLQHC